MKAKIFFKRWILPNIIWIVVLVFGFLKLIGVRGLPDYVHAIYIGLILELAALACWGIYRLIERRNDKQ